jgi:hypothetical protein
MRREKTLGLVHPKPLDLFESARRHGPELSRADFAVSLAHEPVGIENVTRAVTEDLERPREQA